MTRLIVISNRVGLKKSSLQPLAPCPGGLAAALSESLEKQGGLWIGCHPLPFEKTKRRSTLEQSGKISYLLLSLTEEETKDYYEGFANSVLWPLCHYRMDLFCYKTRYLERYFAVNSLFAEHIAAHVRGDQDIIWVHDYHFLDLGAQLRQNHIYNPIGFFLHIPWPSADLVACLPHYEKLLYALSCYDLIGFQTKNDERNFLDLMARQGLKRKGSDLYCFGHCFRTGVFPIGIDTALFQHNAASATQETESAPPLLGDNALDPQFFTEKPSMTRPSLIIGVDRLDYSKGLLERLESYALFMQTYPQYHKKHSFLQIAPPSRATLPSYQDLERQVTQLCGRINGSYGQIGWQPVHYVAKAFSRRSLAGLYRQARIALVTPLRDGMNLVAKEYIAAQNAADPGVLILSRFAGAQEELSGALLVNPYDKEAVADSIATALLMSQEERLARWLPMMEHLAKATVQKWQNDFLFALKTCRR